MQRYQAEHLVDFASLALMKAGLGEPMARDVAEVLVEGDLLGHDTHGLQLLGPYLAEIEKGTMNKGGEPNVLTERTSITSWDGLRLPGPYLVRRALAWAKPRARQHGQASVVIRRSHHIAALASFLEAPAREGFFVILTCSDAATASVAPFGGTQAVFTPNPIAIGFPTGQDPVMIDISASITTNGMSNRMKAAGQKGSHEWWLDALGQPTNDPAVITQNPPGTILPLGGLDAGHKGYGLALLIEALTGGLAGHGRADVAEGWGATVYVQVIDPDAYSGLPGFTWQMDWVAQACKGNMPRNASEPVRLPGERGLARKAAQLEQGVQLHAGIMPALKIWAEKLNLKLPAPLL